MGFQHSLPAATKRTEAAALHGWQPLLEVTDQALTVGRGWRGRKSPELDCRGWQRQEAGCGIACFPLGPWLCPLKPLKGSSTAIQLSSIPGSTAPSRSPQSQDFCHCPLRPQCLCSGLRSHPVYSTLFPKHCIPSKMGESCLT